MELRSKLEIAEASLQEKEALLNDANTEYNHFKTESRETQSLLQLELDKMKSENQTLQGWRLQI